MRKKNISFILQYFLFYRYIKDFDKDRNYLFYDLKAFGLYILDLEKYNRTNHYLKTAKIKFVINNLLHKMENNYYLY